jgi:quercetin dioxygenase-like cupin family protein
MNKSVVSHAAVGVAAAVIASFSTYVILHGAAPSFSEAHAQAPAAVPGLRQTELFRTTMNDVLGRVVTIRRTERDPGTGSPAHRHPGSHTFGYILEGAYEVKIDDGPVRKLGPGEVFYEAPNALHAVSRNASSAQPLKYLVIQVSDLTKPATVPEP